MPVHQFILALQGRMKIALVRMNLRISWKIFLHRKWDLNRLVSKVWYGKRTQLGFGGLNVSPWLNYKMHWNTYDETNVPIRTVLLPNALSMGTLSCMNIYFVYLIPCSWMVTFFFFFLRSFFLAEGLSWMTVLLGMVQAAPFLYRRLRMCMKRWAKSRPQLLRGGLGDGW